MAIDPRLLVSGILSALGKVSGAETLRWTYQWETGLVGVAPAWVIERLDESVRELTAQLEDAQERVVELLDDRLYRRETARAIAADRVQRQVDRAMGLRSLRRAGRVM